jgi:hypothetical protein
MHPTSSTYDNGINNYFFGAYCINQLEEILAGFTLSVKVIF